MHLEAVSGMDLTEFFEDWVYGQGHPSYTVSVSNSGNNQVAITLNQSQSNASVDFFEMPVEVRLYGQGNQVFDVVLEHTTNGQQFIVNVPFVVTDVDFDPNRHIISRNNSATLGLNTLDMANVIQLIPNPTAADLKVEYPSNLNIENIQIYSNLGQLVLETQNSLLNVASLSNGVYYLTITATEGTFHKKFIKN
jgi:hypothetical protein